MEIYNMIIQSLTNPKVKHLVALQRKSYRQEHKQFIAQGITTYQTLLNAGYKLDAVFVTPQAHDQHYQFLNPETMHEVNEAVMAKISTTTTPTGIVAVFEIPSDFYQDLHESHQPVTANALVLHNIQDPGNLGTLIRTAAAMGIDTIFTMQGVDAYHPKVVQATAGTIGLTKVISTNWPIFYKKYKTIPMCALIVQGGNTPEELNLSESILIIGNEGQGLPEEISNACNTRLTIPMPGKTESLNAAVAGSIAMYLKSKNKN